MTDNLSRELLAMMHDQLVAAYPNEGGGFLLGREEHGRATILEITPVHNIFPEAEQYHRYAMTPQDWMRLEDEADARGLTLLGFYHSHPDSPAVPSEYDRVHALPNFIYIIVSVLKTDPVETRVWRLLEDRSRFDEYALEVTQG